MKLTPLFIVVAGLAAGILAGGCRSATPSEGGKGGEAGMEPQAKVTGNAYYLARMAMPKQAVLTVRLEDVSRADAPAVVVGEQAISMQGRQVPIPFEVPYDPSRIDDRGRYNVRASIHVEDRLVFTSTRAHPVLTQGNPATAEVLMERVAAQPAPGAAGRDRPLVDTYWKLAELNGAPVTAAQDQREAHLVLQSGGRFAGSGGINRLLGAYELEDGKLTLKPGPATLMAGPPEAMKQEEAFIAAMKAVTSFTIAGDELTLRAGESPVLEFKAGAPR